MASFASRPSIGNLHPLHRVRVLVVSRDRRFLRAASFLFARSGFLVESTDKPAKVLELVERIAPHVVVLDASQAVVTAARTAAAVEGVRPATTVFLVSEDGEPARVSFPCLDKWSSFRALIDEIERVYGGDGRGGGFEQA